jgi:hypothetical protein
MFKKANPKNEIEDKIKLLSKSINKDIFRYNNFLEDKLKSIDKEFNFILKHELDFMDAKERLISQNLNSLDHENFKNRLKKL